MMFNVYIVLNIKYVLSEKKWGKKTKIKKIDWMF